MCAQTRDNRKCSLAGNTFSSKHTHTQHTRGDYTLLAAIWEILFNALSLFKSKCGASGNVENYLTQALNRQTTIPAWTNFIFSGGREKEKWVSIRFENETSLPKQEYLPPKTQWNDTTNKASVWTRSKSSWKSKLKYNKYKDVLHTSSRGYPTLHNAVGKWSCNSLLLLWLSFKLCSFFFVSRGYIVILRGDVGLTLCWWW